MHFVKSIILMEKRRINQKIRYNGDLDDFRVILLIIFVFALAIISSLILLNDLVNV